MKILALSFVDFKILVELYSMIKLLHFPSTSVIILHICHQIAYAVAIRNGGHGIRRTDVIEAGTKYKLTFNPIDIQTIIIKKIYNN
jgi:hypothetical protein